MRPPTPEGKAECLSLKLRLRECTANGTFVVDAFAAAARTESLDLESRDNGGLIGTRIRQGVCRDPDLDRACFCAPLGRVAGPILSAEGYHLVLVEERLGLEAYDDGMARVVPERSGDGVRSVLAPQDPDEASELLDPGSVTMLVASIMFAYAGGQGLSGWASSIDLAAIAESVP